MVYNTDIWTDKLYKEEVKETIQNSKDANVLAWSVNETWNTSELNKITWEIANSMTNNEHNIRRKAVEWNSNIVKEWQETFWNIDSWNKWEELSSRSVSWVVWLWNQMEMELDTDYTNNYDATIWNELQWIWNKVYSWLQTEYHNYVNFIDNVFLWDVDLNTIKNNTTLKERFDNIKNNYHTLSDEDVYQVLNKYWENSWDVLTIFDLARQNWAKVDLNNLDAYYNSVISDMNIVYNNIWNDWFINSLFEWVKETTNIGWLYEYITKEFWIDKSMSYNLAKQIWNWYWLDVDKKWVLWKIWYWIWALWWNLAEIAAYTALIETWAWAVWLWAKLWQLWKFISNTRVIKKISEVSKFDLFRKINIINKIKWMNYFDKSQLWKYYLKSWALFWTVNAIHDSINRLTRWQDLTKSDILKSFISWFAYWFAWEASALWVLKVRDWILWHIAAVWASAWVNTWIDYLVNWKVDFESMVNNIVFSLLDVYTASKHLDAFVKSADIINKINNVSKDNEVKKLLWNDKYIKQRIMNKVWNILEQCF